MDPDESAQVIEYRNEVIVEIQGTDDQGEIEVVSYQFACEDDGRTLTPKGSVDEGHVSIVHEALDDEGYQWVRGND